jgi:hypothetical protein
MKTTMRYVHPSDADMDEATVKARDAHHGHTSGHTGKTASSTGRTTVPEVNESEEFNGATRRDRTGDLLITNLPIIP